MEDIEDELVAFFKGTYPFEKDELGLNYYEDTINNDYINSIFNVATNCSEISLYCNNYNHFVHAHFQSDTLTFEFGTNATIYLYKKDDELKHSIYRNAKKIKIVIFNEEAIYYRLENKNKLVPLTFKKIYDNLKNPFFYDFVKKLIKYLGKKYPIYNDIFKWIEKDDICLIPLSINETRQYHNLKEMFINKYKLASKLNYGWNKRSVNLSYLIIKSYNYVRLNDKNKLLQIMDFDFDKYVWSNRIKDNIKVFLSAYIQNKIQSNDNQLIIDYVDMCLMSKIKVSISFRSLNKVKEAHDSISLKKYMSKTPVIEIKKDTKFKDLRKILPESFEWIKTRKRLIQETVMQNHCVWSYADKINKDRCQIYSYVDNKTKQRYTLEFVVRNKKYLCVQIQGFNNQANVDKIEKMVQEILKTQTSKH